MTIRFNYVMKLLAQNTLRLSVVTLGSMLTSLLITLSVFFFFDRDLLGIAAWVALATPACIAPVATFALLHYTHQLELAQRSKLEHLLERRNQKRGRVYMHQEEVWKQGNIVPLENLMTGEHCFVHQVKSQYDRFLRWIHDRRDLTTTAFEGAASDGALWGGT